MRMDAETSAALESVMRWQQCSKSEAVRVSIMGAAARYKPASKL